MDGGGYRCFGYRGHPEFGCCHGDGHRFRKCGHHVADAGHHHHLRSEYRHHDNGPVGGIGHVWRQWNLHHGHLFRDGRNRGLYPHVLEKGCLEKHRRYFDRLRNFVCGLEHHVRGHVRICRSRFGENLSGQCEQSVADRLFGSPVYGHHPVLVGSDQYRHHHGGGGVVVA